MPRSFFCKFPLLYLHSSDTLPQVQQITVTMCQGVYRSLKCCAVMLAASPRPCWRFSGNWKAKALSFSHHLWRWHTSELDMCAHFHDLGLKTQWATGQTFDLLHVLQQGVPPAKSFSWTAWGGCGVLKPNAC
jgi:hypothetical protein